MNIFGIHVRVTRKDPEEELAAEYMKGVSDEMKSQARVDSVSGKSTDYWLGWVDGLAEGTSGSGRRAEKSARPRRSSRPHPHLQLVMS